MRALGPGTSKILGTPGYVPRKADLSQPDARFDVYGLGATIFRLCTAPEFPPSELRPTVTATVNRVFEDARRSHVSSLNDIGELTRTFGEMWIDREQRFADESARQRALIHQSLADIKVVEMNARLSGAPAPARARRVAAWS